MSFQGRFPDKVPSIVDTAWAGQTSRDVYNWMRKGFDSMAGTTSQLVQIFGSPGGALQGLLTTLGDLLTFDGTNPARLPVGDPLAVLAADPSATLGLAYHAQLAKLMQTCTSFWRLDEASGGRLDSIGRVKFNDLTPQNSPSNVAGKVGSALLVDGSVVPQRMVRITAAAQSGLDPGTADFSISAWAYITALDPIYGFHIFSRGASGSGVFCPGYILSVTASGNVFVTLGDNTHTAIRGGQFSTNIFPSLNAWHHYALSVDRDGSFTLRVDGVLAVPFSPGNSALTSAFGDTTGPITPSADLALGCGTQNGGAADFAVQGSGRIDAVGFWNGYLLTQSDMALLYSAGRGLELFPLWNSRGAGASDIPAVNRRPPADVTIYDGYGVVVPAYYDLSAFGVTLDLQGDAVLEII